MEPLPVIGQSPLEQMVRDLQRAMHGLQRGEDTGWKVPTLQNGWVLHGAEVVGYRRVNGIVYTRGMIKDGTTTDGTLIFTFPVGFRPITLKHVATVANGIGATIKVVSDGSVQCGGGVSASWTSLVLPPFIAEG